MVSTWCLLSPCSNVQWAGIKNVSKFSQSEKYRSRKGFSAARFLLRCSTDSSIEVRSANYSMRSFYGMRDFPWWLSLSVSFMSKSWHLFKAPIRSPLNFSLWIDGALPGFQRWVVLHSLLWLRELSFLDCYLGDKRVKRANHGWVFDLRIVRKCWKLDPASWRADLRFQNIEVPWLLNSFSRKIQSQTLFDRYNLPVLPTVYPWLHPNLDSFNSQPLTQFHLPPESTQTKPLQSPNYRTTAKCSATVLYDDWISPSNIRISIHRSRKGKAHPVHGA